MYLNKSRQKCVISGFILSTIVGMGIRDSFKAVMEKVLARPGAKTSAPESVYAGRDVDSELEVDNSLVTEYRKRGRLPAFPKILTLARAYDVTVSKFYKAIGGTDKEICGHSFTEQEQGVIDDLNEVRGDIYLMLWWILQHGTKKQAESLEESIDQFFKNVKNDEMPPWVESLKKARAS